MERIFKYELIISEALKSAINYDTPDEQIMEFIRFFGKHINSDRIYIFEDNINNHTTDNTYEWCNDGIVPQIDKLQNVDKDIIGWWYEAFDKGESVIVSSVDELYDTRRLTYDILSVQNVNNLVVCPIRHKENIRGFFGVDNPPGEDYGELSVFLDMIGTILISLLNIRNSFRKSSDEAKIDSYATLAEIYLSMHLIDMKTGTYQTIRSTELIDGSMDSTDVCNFPRQIKNVMKRLCTERYLDSVLKFVDLSTLEERMGNKSTIAHEYLGNVSGWCRERFIKADYDEDGNLWHVLYCVEVIDEEKRRENRLLYLSETDSMTGISNRGCGERKITDLLKKHIAGIFCILDCDKFKSINDTHGHAVGDKVIVAVAETLQKVCRENDVVLRLGGDEFAMYIPGLLEYNRAKEFIKHLFDEFAKIRVSELGENKIYVSLGASFCYKDEEISFDQLYREADKAMYQSKKKSGYSAMIYQDNGFLNSPTAGDE